MCGLLIYLFIFQKLYEKLKADIEAAKNDETISGSWSKDKRQNHDAYVEVKLVTHSLLMTEEN